MRSIRRNKWNVHYLPFEKQDTSNWYHSNTKSHRGWKINGETPTSLRKDFFKSLWSHILWQVGSHIGKNKYWLVVAIQNIIYKYPSIKRVKLMKNSWREKGKSCFLGCCCCCFLSYCTTCGIFSSLTRDRNWALSSESAKSQPLNHNKSPEEKVFLKSVVNG